MIADKKIACALLLTILANASLLKVAHAQTIKLSAKDEGRVFEGIGAVSAGASTRNLVDYPAKQRAEVLDYLFKPKFGAGFQHLKVEIGSGENSTCGSEPSTVITRNELEKPVARGYEFWLMAEARKRNPRIILDCLPWGYPNWVKTRFSNESAAWIVSFLETARKHYGVEVNWVSAAQNEMGTDLNWVRTRLRPMLNTHGFRQVKLQAPDDDSEFWQIFDKLEKQPVLNALVNAVGYHYIDGREPWDIDQKTNRSATEKARNAGKPLWASEEWSQSGQSWEGKGALYLARLINKLYTVNRVTKFEIWCPVDGIYNQVIWGDTGVMQADAPWSGHYNVWPAVWAVAHTTQFAEPGWVYMNNACGQIDKETWRGSHVALRNPATGDWSVIIVSGDQRKITLQIGPGLKKSAIHVWKSTSSEQFIEQKPPTLNLTDNTFTLNLASNAIYTLTTTKGQQKGYAAAIPQAVPFPFPYQENFDGYKHHATPRFFSDQKGSFEVIPSPGGGMCLAQVVPEQGILWYDNWLLKPHTLIGDENWQDYSINSDVLLRGGDVEIGGRYADRNKLGYRWILTRDGRWQLNWQNTVLASGQINQFKPSIWHQLRLDLKGNVVTGYVDGDTLVSVTDNSALSGMCFLASTYDNNLFDNFKITSVQ